MNEKGNYMVKDNSNKADKILTSPVARNDEMPWKIWSQIGVLKKERPGTVIWQQGEESEYVYIIKKGTVRIDYLNFHGKTLCLYILSDGMIVGEGAVISKKPHNYQCVTLGECEMYAVSSQLFRQMLSESVEFSNLVLEQTLQKRLFTDEAIFQKQL